MKSPYVSELQPNQIITATLLVHIKDVRQKKSGEPYLSLLLGDRTGELDAKMWDNVVDVLEAFERDDFVKVKGLLQIYQNRPQLTVHKLAQDTRHGGRFRGFFPVLRAQRGRDVRGVAARSSPAIGNPHLRGLLDAFMRDEQFVRLFKIAPAAKSVHHAFLGGLAGACSIALQSQPDDGLALQVRRCRSGAHGRHSARYRQDRRTDLRPQLRLQHRRPTAGPHRDRSAHARREAGSVSRTFPRACAPWSST